MSPQDAWEALGIEPTDDKRAVKRAYAVKLKSIDPDADPKAFLALRDALQIAQWEAEYGPDEEYDYQEYEEGGAQWKAVEDNPEFTHVITDEDVDRFDADPAFMPHDFVPQSPPDGFEARNRIDGLIWQEDRTPAGDAELVEAVAELLSDARMEQVDFASEAEEWLARSMAYAIPQSDPIIPIVVDHFGWDARRMNVRETFGLAECAARADDLACIARLSSPTHKWHDAYERLKSPGPNQISFMERRRNKQTSLDLLQSLREHNSAVERSLNAQHVALWDDILVKDVNKIASTGTASDWGTLRIGFFVLLFLAQFLRLCMPDNPLQPQSTPQLSSGFEKIMWRDQQAPRVQAWMDANRPIVDALFLEQASKGGGMPNCAALDVAASLSDAEYDTCYAEQAVRDTQKLPPVIGNGAVPVPGPAKSGTYYHSPLWQSEQAPRVRAWMEEHRDEIDQLLKPHVKAGGLPDCGKLAAVAGLSPSELDMCRVGQSRRAAGIPEAPPPQAPLPKPAPPLADPKPIDAKDVCKVASMENSPICKPPLPINTPMPNALNESQ